MDGKASEIIKLWEQGDGDRGTWKSHWQRVTDYMQPDRNDYVTQKSPGQKRMRKIYDSHPIWCLEQFVAGCDSLLTSSTLQWFFLRCDDDRIDKVARVRAWFEAASAAMYAVFNSSRHNFSPEQQSLYGDLGAVGTGVQAILESKRSGILFSTRHLKECVIYENEEGRVDTLIRRWEWTAKQAWQTWGSAAGNGVAEAMKDKPDTKFVFYHAVRPRMKRDPQRAGNLNMAFESIYVSEADKRVISESGFQEFPYCVPRLSKITGESWGRGRGMTALPDVQMLNELMKLVIESGQLLVRPPYQLPDDGYILPIRAAPGSLIFYRAGLRQTDRLQKVDGGGQFDVGENMIEALHNSIARIFYVDLFRMPTDPSDPNSEGKGSTATYWLQRRDKEMMQLSPMLTRLNSEDSGPKIERVFAMMWRQSVAKRFGPGAYFPPPPPELSGQKWHAEYVSPIAIAQKSSRLDSVKQLIAQQAEIRQIDPQSPIYMDWQSIMRMSADDLNAPAGALKTDEQLQAEAQQQAEAEAAMQNHMALANVAQAAKDGTGAVKNLADASSGQMREAA